MTPAPAKWTRPLSLMLFFTASPELLSVLLTLLSAPLHLLAAHRARNLPPKHLDSHKNPPRRRARKCPACQLLTMKLTMSKPHR
ncbi:hypothetical protein T484DRAFT_1980130 [Baffinella frigidus]|nr:hypothetical protein T484DRAFT_1980130 [Cryptophyta sp. CCMP2293]